MAAGVPSDLHRPWDLLPTPGVDTPAEPRLSIQGRLTLQTQDPRSRAVSGKLEGGEDRGPCHPEPCREYGGWEPGPRAPPASSDHDRRQTQEPGGALVLRVNWRQSSSVHSACVQNGVVSAQPSASCPRGRAQAPGLPHKLLVCYEALPSLQSPT